MGFRREVFWPDGTVVDGSVVFGDVVGVVVRARSPEVAELLLCGAAAEPVELHIHRLEAFAGDVIGDDAEGSRIISLHWRWWLWVAHFK